eukprot:g3791.t1
MCVVPQLQRPMVVLITDFVDDVADHDLCSSEDVDATDDYNPFGLDQSDAFYQEIYKKDAVPIVVDDEPVKLLPLVDPEPPPPTDGSLRVWAHVVDGGVDEMNVLGGGNARPKAASTKKKNPNQKPKSEAELLAQLEAKAAKEREEEEERKKVALAQQEQQTEKEAKEQEKETRDQERRQKLEAACASKRLADEAGKRQAEREAAAKAKQQADEEAERENRERRKKEMEAAGAAAASQLKSESRSSAVTGAADAGMVRGGANADPAAVTTGGGAAGVSRTIEKDGSTHLHSAPAAGTADSTARNGIRVKPNFHPAGAGVHKSDHRFDANAKLEKLEDLVVLLDKHPHSVTLADHEQKDAFLPQHRKPHVTVEDHTIGAFMEHVMQSGLGTLNAAIEAHTGAPPAPAAGGSLLAVSVPPSRNRNKLSAALPRIYEGWTLLNDLRSEVQHRDPRKRVATSYLTHEQDVLNAARAGASVFSTDTERILREKVGGRLAHCYYLSRWATEYCQTDRFREAEQNWKRGKPDPERALSVFNASKSTAGGLGAAGPSAQKDAYRPGATVQERDTGGILVGKVRNSTPGTATDADVKKGAAIKDEQHKNVASGMKGKCGAAASIASPPTSDRQELQSRDQIPGLDPLAPHVLVVCESFEAAASVAGALKVQARTNQAWKPPPGKRVFDCVWPFPPAAAQHKNCAIRVTYCERPKSLRGAPAEAARELVASIPFPAPSNLRNKIFESSVEQLGAEFKVASQAELKQLFVARTSSTAKPTGAPSSASSTAKGKNDSQNDITIAEVAQQCHYLVLCTDLDPSGERWAAILKEKLAYSYLEEEERVFRMRCARFTRDDVQELFKTIRCWSGTRTYTSLGKLVKLAPKQACGTTCEDSSALTTASLVHEEVVCKFAAGLSQVLGEEGNVLTAQHMKQVPSLASRRLPFVGALCELAALHFCMDRKRKVGKKPCLAFETFGIEFVASLTIVEMGLTTNESYDLLYANNPSKEITATLSIKSRATCENDKADRDAATALPGEGIRVLAPPAPLCTAELLRSAAGEGLLPEQVLETALRLYHQGLISFPLTKSRSYPRLPVVERVHYELCDCKAFAHLKIPTVKNTRRVSSLLQEGAPNAHASYADTHAIMPLRLLPSMEGHASTTAGTASEVSRGAKPLNNAEADARVYSLIARHFLASLSPELHYTEWIFEAKLGEAGHREGVLCKLSGEKKPTWHGVKHEVRRDDGRLRDLLPGFVARNLLGLRKGQISGSATIAKLHGAKVQKVELFQPQMHPPTDAELLHWLHFGGDGGVGTDDVYFDAARAVSFLLQANLLHSNPQMPPKGKEAREAGIDPSATATQSFRHLSVTPAGERLCAFLEEMQDGKHVNRSVSFLGRNHQGFMEQKIQELIAREPGVTKQAVVGLSDADRASEHNVLGNLRMWMDAMSKAIQKRKEEGDKHKAKKLPTAAGASREILPNSVSKSKPPLSANHLSNPPAVKSSLNTRSLNESKAAGRAVEAPTKKSDNAEDAPLGKLLLQKGQIKLGPPPPPPTFAAVVHNSKERTPTASLQHHQHHHQSGYNSYEDSVAAYNYNYEMQLAFQAGQQQILMYQQQAAAQQQMMMYGNSFDNFDPSQMGTAAPVPGGRYYSKEEMQPEQQDADKVAIHGPDADVVVEADDKD